MSEPAVFATKTLSHEAAQRKTLWSLVSWCLSGEILSTHYYPTTTRQAMPQIKQIVFACLAMFFAQDVVNGFSRQAVQKQAALEKEKVAAFSFADARYFHRFSKGDQHEYTPDRQEDLNAWTDMVTILFYRNAKDGEALAATANSVLENYKANKAMVLKTDSVPRGKDKPAEHLVVVVFGRPGFIEAVFARFRMHDGVGTAVIYSHRLYGSKIGDEMSAWLKTNGPAAERNLMKWDAMPAPPFPSN